MGEKKIQKEDSLMGRVSRRITSGFIIFIIVYGLSILLAQAMIMMNLDKLQVLFRGTLDNENVQGLSGLLKLAGIIMNSTFFSQITLDDKMIQIGFLPLLILPALGVIISNFGFNLKKPSLKLQTIEYITISIVYMLLNLIISGLIQMKDATYSSISLLNGVSSFILLVLLQYIIGNFFENKGSRSKVSKYFDVWTGILFTFAAIGVLIGSIKVFGLKEIYFSVVVLLNGIAYLILFMAGVPLEYSILGDKGGLTFFNILFQDSLFKIIAIPMLYKVGALILVAFYLILLFIIMGKVLKKTKWIGVLGFTFMVGAMFFVLSYASRFMIKNLQIVGDVDVSTQFGANPIWAIVISSGTCLVMAVMQLLLLKSQTVFVDDEDENEDTPINGK